MENSITETPEHMQPGLGGRRNDSVIGCCEPECWLGGRAKYRRRASEAAAWERIKSWSIAAQAWEVALVFATGSNVQWCQSRIDWCLRQAEKPSR